MDLVLRSSLSAGIFGDDNIFVRDASVSWFELQCELVNTAFSVPIVEYDEVGRVFSRLCGRKNLELVASTLRGARCLNLGFFGMTKL